MARIPALPVWLEPPNAGKTRLNNPGERAPREFRVHYSTGQPARSDQPLNNTFGLTGEGKLVIVDGALVFEGQRSGFTLAGNRASRSPTSPMSTTTRKAARS